MQMDAPEGTAAELERVDRRTDAPLQLLGASTGDVTEAVEFTVSEAAPMVVDPVEQQTRQRIEILEQKLEEAKEDHQSKKAALRSFKSSDEWITDEAAENSEKWKHLLEERRQACTIHRTRESAAAGRTINWARSAGVQDLLPEGGADSHFNGSSGYYGLLAQLGTVDDKYKDAIAKLLGAKQFIAIVASRQAALDFKQKHPNNHRGIRIVTPAHGFSNLQTEPRDETIEEQTHSMQRFLPFQPDGTYVYAVNVIKLSKAALDMKFRPDVWFWALKESMIFDTAAAMEAYWYWC